jgi:HD superfamily phosphohydrolase
MRLAALLHDTGHCLYSHASERVFSRLQIVKSAAGELSRFVGKEKGAGEVLAFCLALSDSVQNLLDRAQQHVIGEVTSDDYEGPINLTNVALMIVGRGPHPFLQFLGDIISSGFDADKLDYLFRDAAGAGLPLRYDLDRYLYSVQLEKDVLSDGDGELQALYAKIEAPHVERRNPVGQIQHPHYETYRLRLPKEAMNTIEQIVLCKLMLFSYMYHHQKVRAAEGLLEKMLARAVDLWKARDETEEKILKRFLGATDSCLFSALDNSLGDAVVTDYSYRIVNRLLPREVYALSGTDGSHADALLLRNYLIDLQKREKRDTLIREFERAIGEELRLLRPELAERSWEEALLTAGVWFDVPKPPTIDEIKELVIGSAKGAGALPLTKLFPVGEWTEAYTHFRYQVRIFAFSEYWDAASSAARQALEEKTKIADAQFYQDIKRERG